jgi:mannan endo-1,4-beta-mannosidase
MRTRPPQPGPAGREFPRASRRSHRVDQAITAATGISLVALVIVMAALLPTAPSREQQASCPVGRTGDFRHHHVVITLPVRPASYLGAFAQGVPGSYAPVKSFAAATGVRPNLAPYDSGWNEKFQTAFNDQSAGNGAIPLIQIDPTHISLATIAAGMYDTYLDSLATDVARYGAKTGHGVIIGFGHGMNGYWYPWGHRQTSPAVFVAAWRHIVDVFRQQGADDVTWLWTVNVIDARHGIPSPAPWWPGRSYVTWVGIDGYYLKPTWTFASLFGPTIRAVRAMTSDPIIISETGAAAAGQPAKITNMFAGIHAYRLLGFVWFDANGIRDFRIQNPDSFAALRRGAHTFKKAAF